MQTQYVSCPTCKSQNIAGSGLCANCGTPLPLAPMPMQHVAQGKIPGAEKKIAAGICGILLGGFGVHKFILGYNTEGIIMLVAWVVGMFLTCGIASIAVGIVGLIEGIIYLTKSDEEFVRTYIQGKKAW